MLHRGVCEDKPAAAAVVHKVLLRKQLTTPAALPLAQWDIVVRELLQDGGLHDALLQAHQLQQPPACSIDGGFVLLLQMLLLLLRLPGLCMRCLMMLMLALSARPHDLVCELIPAMAALSEPLVRLGTSSARWDVLPT